MELSHREARGINVGGYDLLGRVADSASGAVWKGHDSALNRDVALKQVAVNAEAQSQRLRDEARILATLVHPNIVTVFDLVEESGQLWLIEEWVDGATLSKVVAASGRLSPQQALGVVRGALEGLAQAHRQGVVHGDVSPANILLDRSGDSKLIDFGLAAGTGATAAGGTPGYLSPEAAKGLASTPQSDVYAAGAVLAMLLRGRPLFDGPTAEAVLAAQLRREPELDSVDGEIRSMLAVALATDPARRYADAERFLRALEDAAQRRYGAGWSATAGVAGLVAATGSAGLVMMTGGESAATAAAAPATEVAVEPGAAQNVFQPASAVRRTARPRSTHITIAGRSIAKVTAAVTGGAAAAVVAAAVVTSVALASDSKKPVAASTTSAPASSSGSGSTALAGPTASSSGPASTAVSTVTSAPVIGLGANIRGGYRFSAVATSIEGTVVSNKVGETYTATWTVTPNCPAGSTACVLKVASSNAEGYTFTFSNGSWVAETDVTGPCRDANGPTGVIVTSHRVTHVQATEDGSQLSGTENYLNVTSCAPGQVLGGTYWAVTLTRT